MGGNVKNDFSIIFRHGSHFRRCVHVCEARQKACQLGEPIVPVCVKSWGHGALFLCTGVIFNPPPLACKKKRLSAPCAVNARCSRSVSLC